MDPIFLAVALSITAYIAAVSLIPRHVLFGSSAYTHQTINRLRQQNLQTASSEANKFTFAQVEVPFSTNPLVRALLLIPGMKYAVPLLQRAGVWRTLDQFALALLLLFLFMLFALSRPLGILALPVAAGATWAIAVLFLKYMVKKKLNKFMQQFPEALDVMIRSVRVGHPIPTAIRVIGEHTPAPLGPEFARVSEEINYGASLLEALTRLATRIDDPDVRFFIVALAVQQESGGNIAETLQNLSTVIRKRSHLRMKIRSLSAEGRMTAWIVGSIPFFFAGIIYYSAPDHLTPLFTTGIGNILLLSVLAMIVAGIVTVRHMINLEV